MYACTFIEIYTRGVYYEGFILEAVGSTLVVRMRKGPIKNTSKHRSIRAYRNILSWKVLRMEHIFTSYTTHPISR